MGKHKDFSKSGKEHILMDEQLGLSNSKTTALMGCSRSALVRTYQKWFMEGKPIPNNRMMRSQDSLMHMGNKDWPL